MDVDEFREFGRASIDYIADYIENIRERPVLPSVEPGYLQKLVAKDVPEKPDCWRNVLSDMESLIMPGMTHWHSPRFHAFYPTANSYPAVIGELLSAGIGCIGFSWAASPACTELEVVVMDWLAKLMNLPKVFLHSSDGPGGGTIQGSASEATLVCLLAAKEKTFRRIQESNPYLNEWDIKGKLVAYTSDQSNSSVEKAGLLASVKMRLLPSDPAGQLRGDILAQTVENDLKDGLIPAFVCATFGTTSICSFDNIDELSAVCSRHNIWLHVDAAYAGAALICPEFRHLMPGLNQVDSFNMNPHKWLLVNFDCSALWVKNAFDLTNSFNVDRIYLQHHRENLPCAPDYRHWQIPLGRRFRSLKLWFTLRLYGAENLRAHIRKQVQLAKMFHNLVLEDPEFEIPVQPNMGLVCFRLKMGNQETECLYNRLINRRHIYLTPGKFSNTYIIRFVVCSRITEERDILFAWDEIRSQARHVINDRKKAKKYDENMNENKQDVNEIKIKNIEAETAESMLIKSTV